MNFILFIFLGLLLLLFQGFIQELFLIQHWRPEVLGILIIWLARSKRFILSLWLILVLGFLQDLFAGTIIGFHALLGQALFYLFVVFFQIFQYSNEIQSFFIGLIGGFSIFILHYAMVFFILDSQLSMLWDQGMLHILYADLLSMSLLTPLFFWSFRKFEYYLIRNHDNRLL